MGYRIAVTDDDNLNLKTAQHILSLSGYEVDCLHSGEELLDYLAETSPDLILLDVHMPGIDGFETIRRIKDMGIADSTPIIFLTADDDKETETKALSFGAMDFVKKPFVEIILLLRVRNTIELFQLQNNLKAEVKNKTEEVIREHERNERLSLQVVKTLAGAIDAKDKYTNGHSERVAKYSREIAKRAGYSEREQNEIYMMGLLHDVGKIGISDAIINKPSRLTDEEYGIIKSHPMLGFGILRNITEMPKLSFAARWHHERYDGSGYPDGLKGTDIPEEARLVAVADAYDAMASVRTYHKVLDQDYVKNEIKKGIGTQFDPHFAEIMIDIIEKDTNYVLQERPDDQPTEEEIAEDNKISNDSFLSVLQTGGIDTESGMNYCMNDIDFYAEILEEFAESSEDRRIALTNAIEAAECERYRISVHALKSASRTVGASELSENAEKMENAAKVNDLDHLNSNHSDLISLLQKNVTLIRTALYLRA